MMRSALPATCLAIALVLSGCAGADSESNALADVPADSAAMDSRDVPTEGVDDSSQADAPDDADADTPDDPDAHPDLPPTDAATDTPDDTPADAPPAIPYAAVGRVHVIREAYATGSMQARLDVTLWSFPFPTSQERVAWNDECIVLVGEDFLGALPCDPACPTGALCIRGQCEPLPEAAASGRITLSGLAVPVALDPGESGAYTLPTDLPADLFEPGALVTATSAGGDTAAFTLSARGVEDLEADVEAIVVHPGEDLVVRWTPASTPVAGTRIQLWIDTGWHGSPNLTTLWCETDDDGRLTVPAALTARIPQVSCGKCQSSWLARFTRSTFEGTHGTIDMEVLSRRLFVPWW